EQRAAHAVVELLVLDDVAALLEQERADRAHDARPFRAAQRQDERAGHDAPRPGWSALDDVEGEPAAGGLLVLVLHVRPGLAHGLDRLVDADLVAPVAAHGEPGRGDGFDGAHRVALDAGDLDQPAYGVAGEAEVVLDADLGGVLDLFGGAAEHLGQARGGHGAGRAHLALAADIGAGDGGVLLEQQPDRGGGEQEPDHAVVGVRADEAPV